MVALVIDPVSRKRERGLVFSVSPTTKAPPHKKEFLTVRRHPMKISKKVMEKIVFSLVMLFLLTPLTVFAQDGFYVIPVAVNKSLKNIITVAKAGGKFTDPVAAVNSITDASASNPYLVVIAPGVYTIKSTLYMKEYVDIAGSGENVTKLTGAISLFDDWPTSAIIKGANNTSLTSLTIENTGTSSYSIALYNGSSSLRVANVTATASGSSANYGIFNSYASSTRMTNVTATATGAGMTSNCGVYNYLSSPTMTGVTATASGGTERNYGVYNSHSSPKMTNVNATASGGIKSYGVYNEYYSSPVIKRSTMDGGVDGLFTDEYSTANISQSTIIMGISGGGTNTCVACDNGNGTLLGDDCGG
jgi:hypothetical protein